MTAKRQKLDSCSESANDALTIYDAPNVCREIMAKCQSLAERAEPGIAAEIAEIGNKTKQMLDAIMASVDKILAMEEVA